NPAAELLRSNSPLSVLGEWITDPFHFQTYSHLMHTVRTGQPAMEIASGGLPVFEHFKNDPEHAKLFNDAMTALSSMVIPAVLKAYDFSGIGTLVDVGGGHGFV